MFTFLWEDVYIGVLDEKCTCEIETVFNCTLIGSSLLKKLSKSGLLRRVVAFFIVILNV